MSKTKSQCNKEEYYSSIMDWISKYCVIKDQSAPVEIIILSSFELLLSEKVFDNFNDLRKTCLKEAGVLLPIPEFMSVV